MAKQEESPQVSPLTNQASVVNERLDWYLIVNPVAGAGKADRCMQALTQHLGSAGIRVDIHSTRFPGEATILAQEALQKGYQRLIVVGGDGTLHEVINGLMEGSTPLPMSFRLGVIPVGTGTDWARMYKFPANLKKQVEILQNGQVIHQDVGKVEFVSAEGKAHQYFVNIAGLGFDAQVVANTQEQSKAGLKGQLIYFLGIFRTLLQYAPQAVRVISDEVSRTYQSLSANVGLCRYSGGGMRMVPLANSTDGFFDITIIGDLSPWQVIRHLPKLYNGNIYKPRQVDRMITDRIVFEGPVGIPIEADGEFLGHTPATFSILPGAIPILISAQYQPSES